jgi:hypothetical protein
MEHLLSGLEQDASLSTLRVAFALPLLAATDQTDGDTFDRERSRPGIDDDRCELGVLGQEHDVASAPESQARTRAISVRLFNSVAAKARGGIFSFAPPYQGKGTDDEL